MPAKTKEVQNHHMDSRVWNDFNYREGDIVVGSYIRSGTTWLQQIVGQLIFNGKADVPIAEIAPWLDMRFPSQKEKLEMFDKQKHRRSIKTHLPANAIVLSDKAKYLYIARDGRDVAWSTYFHYANGNDYLFDLLNNTPGRIGPAMERPPESKAKFFKDWLDKDGYPIWSFWENIKTWWKLKDFPNVKLLHYNNLKDDLEGSVRDIASFLEIPINEDKMGDILYHCSFDYMKGHGEPIVPLNGGLWEGGAKTFVRKGVNNDWKGEFLESDCLRYEKMARDKLGDECANWLKTGMKA